MAQAIRKKSSQTPAWIWFLAGALTSGLAVGLLCLNQGAISSGAKPRPVVQMPPQRPKPEAKKDAPKPRFDFYTVLPEMEVVIPEEEIRKPPKIEPEKTPTDKSASAPIFLLQMGSFRNYQDADRLKPKLALQGIEADIQSVTIANAQGKASVHRVRGGPYTQSQAHALHGQLKGNQINSLIIKINKD